MNFNFINLQPYSNPQYFIYLLIALIPMVIGLYFGKRLKIYEAIFSLVFIFLIFDGTHWQQGVNIILYLIYEFIITFVYLRYRTKKNSPNKTWIFCLAVILAILPLTAVKVLTAMPVGTVPFVVGFLGISYITFKNVQVPN